MLPRDLRILNVILSLDPKNGGGSVERTIQMSRFLAQAGARCTVLTSDQGLTSERRQALNEMGVELVALPCLNERFYLTSLPYGRIKAVVSGADIVHLMNHWTFQNAVVYFLARRLRKPHVLCAAGSLRLSGRSRFLKILYNAVVGRRIVQDAACCIAITADEVEQYKSYGVDPRRIVVIPNGITREQLATNDAAAFRGKFGIGSGRIILFAGRLNHIKGPDLLLRAFCNLKDVLADHHLVFMGADEGMLPILKDMAAAQGVQDRVHFVGYLEAADKSHAYNAAELLVIPSRQEAMSIVVLEAGIAGKPVLLTDRCGFDVVEKMDGGRVVPASVQGLQGGLAEMLRDGSGLEAMGGNLKSFVTENYLWSSLIGKYLDLYSRILQGGTEKS